MRTLSKILTELKNIGSPDSLKVSFSDIIEFLHERGFGVLLFVFALPAALPLPGLGINLIIALPLLLLTIQQAMGRGEVWVPKWMKSKTISKERFQKILSAALPFVYRLEKLVKPRLGFITQGVFSPLIGLAGLIMALSICVPLPLTNTVPAMGIAIMALGVVMRDGLAVIAGAALGLLWVAALSLSIMFLGVEAVDIIKDWLHR